jgi:hypothetical protein
MEAKRRAVALLAAGAWWVLGCSKQPPPPPAKPPASKPVTLTLEQARQLATRLANNAFSAQRFVSPTGEPVFIKGSFRPTSWRRAEIQDERWVFVAEQPTGPQATVTFRLDGNDPKVNVGFVFE